MKRIIFILLSVLFFIFAFFRANPIENELTKAFINPESYVVKLAGLSSSYLNVILEGDTEDEVEDLKSLLPENQGVNIKEVTDIYRDYPENFLSENTRTKLIEENYEQFAQESLERVYSPLGIFIAPPDSDPYLLATDFVIQNTGGEDIKKINNKVYSLKRFKINNLEDTAKFIEAQKSAEHGKIYLAGAPVHSYLTSQKSAFEINIICIISTLGLILLCRYYFKSIKILIPISLSILYGFLLGYSVSAIIFSRLHILTFVFSTSLIGISLDYSLHYFLTGKEKGFRKNLTASMLTTVLAFMTLTFSNMEILKQIAVFTSFGLLGVYLFVLIVFPKEFKFTHRDFPKIRIAKLKPVFLTIIALVIIAGGLKLKFNDDIKNLYKPSKNLTTAEKIYKDIFNPQNTEFILVKGKNTDDILEQEEKMQIKDSLSLANFVSSKSRQLENQTLVKKLYQKNLDEYGKFLGQENIDKIKNKEFKLYDTERFPLNKDFMLDKNTSYILINGHQEGSISPSGEMSRELKSLRKECITLAPVVYGVLLILLSFFFGFKNSLKIIISPLLGVIFSIGLISLLGEEINLFNILALFLITGFSLDYSIFRLNSSEKSKDAVFMSALSTAFSFLMLSFTGFKLISTLGLTLFLGITTSYLLSLFMIKSTHERTNET